MSYDRRTRCVASRRRPPGSAFPMAPRRDPQKLLDRLLEEAGLERSDVFITNVVKARPPGNRDPKPDEVAHHLPWLEAQLEVIAPKLIVPLGRHALARFVPDAKITQAHGSVLERDGRTLFPMFHPAAALRNPKLRTTLHEDAKALRAAL